MIRIILLFGLLLSIFIGKAEAHTVSATHKAHFVWASWYNLPGNIMSNGRIFKSGDSTIVANRSLPFGTALWVRYPKTGKVLKVIVQDRGPAKSTGRKLDLSEAAANILGYTSAGVVRLQVLSIKYPNRH